MWCSENGAVTNPSQILVHCILKTHAVPISLLQNKWWSKPAKKFGASLGMWIQVLYDMSQDNIIREALQARNGASLPACCPYSLNFLFQCLVVSNAWIANPYFGWLYNYIYSIYIYIIYIYIPTNSYLFGMKHQLKPPRQSAPQSHIPL